MLNIKFKMFVIVSIVVAFALLGFTFAKYESQSNKLNHTVVQLSTAQQKIKALANQVAASTQNQLSNRVENVATWCGAINEGRDYNRERLVPAISGGKVNYALPDLNCKQLKTQTSQSSQQGK